MLLLRPLPLLPHSHPQRPRLNLSPLSRRLHRSPPQCPHLPRTYHQGRKPTLPLLHFIMMSGRTRLLVRSFRSPWMYVCSPDIEAFAYDVYLLLGSQPAEAMKNEFEYVWLKSAVESESSDGNSSTRLYMAPTPYSCHLHRKPSSEFRQFGIGCDYTS